MVWVAFSAAGTAELLHCERSMNALEYRRILQKGIIPTIEKLFSKGEQSDFSTRQCSCPHCEDHEHVVENGPKHEPDGLSQSPDLNPIENI